MTIVEFEHGLTDKVTVKDNTMTPGVVTALVITTLGRSYGIVYPDGETHWHEETEIEPKPTSTKDIN